MRAVFAGLLTPAPSTPSSDATRYRLERESVSGFRVVSTAEPTTSLADLASLLLHLDTCLTISAQCLRPDLLFLHAAAVVRDGRVIVLPGSSGAGKSTLTLALLDRGYAYFSDELAPIDCETRVVYPYRRAVCLKTPPPPPHRLPQATIAVGSRFYVQIDPSAASLDAPLPLSAVIFIRQRSSREGVLHTISPASATARLVAHTLNSLAHSGAGLDPASAVAKSVPCYRLYTADLTEACNALDTFSRRSLSTEGG